MWHHLREKRLSNSRIRSIVTLWSDDDYERDMTCRMEFATRDARFQYLLSREIYKLRGVGLIEGDGENLLGAINSKDEEMHKFGLQTLHVLREKRLKDLNND